MENYATLTLDELSQMEAQQVLVLTVNNRHARRVLSELLTGLDDARRVMAVPDIVPLSGWLARLADQLAFLPESGQAMRTVDGFGAQWLWQNVIDEAEADHALLDVAQAARLAAEADRLMDDWRIQVQPHAATPDYQRFDAWRTRYRALLADRDLDDGNLSYLRIIQSLEQGSLPLSFTTLVLAGFNELSPRLSHMLRCLEQQGVQLRVLARAVQPATAVSRIEAQDLDDEWRQAARWAAEQLTAHPEGRFAIVAARLEADVVLAHRYLRTALGGQTPYNVAVARPLADWPLVRAALAWLRVMSVQVQRKAFTPADLGAALLAGGCVAARDERAARAAIDAYWRQRAVVSVPAASFQNLLEKHTPQLAQAWLNVGAALDNHAAPAEADTWVQRFRALLEALGFPGEGALDSHAYQVMEAFDRVLDQMARLAFVTGPLRFSAAVSLLLKLTRETPFQPERDPAARLDVLGLLESEGGRWDGVWVLGLTDEVMPAAPRPNPFIPLAALRETGAPRATPERELQWAHAMYASLLECAPKVWLSHALHEGERELRPSPCIGDVPLAVMAPEEPGYAPMAAGQTALEYVVDEQGPPLKSDAVTRGGIGVIDTQARNPLWAFVKFRLGARVLSGYADVFDQNARGLLLHRAAEIIWRLLPGQQALKARHEQDSLGILIEEAVALAADEFLADYGQTLRALETARAESLLHEWLMVELARTPFRVHDIEQDYTWTHGLMSLSLRLDRVDVLDEAGGGAAHDKTSDDALALQGSHSLFDDDSAAGAAVPAAQAGPASESGAGGRLVVIDYKTGAGKIDPKSDWMRERPVGLQLPFYASVLAQENSPVGALVLLKLHARGIEARGLQDVDCGLGGVAALPDWPAFADYSWEELMHEWRTTIQNLAQEFSTGVAHNRSLRTDDLKYCDVEPFLRLNEEYPSV
ncbi:hypothetical protein D7I39_01090 [Allopusillimonas ginsengisoli]|nr:hypothetical protein D7I39_01090 [Allopusillimonas ginsengisoli]